MGPYTLLLHPNVESDLNDIADLVEEFAGRSIARSKLLAIKDVVLKLADTPHTGSMREDIYPGLRAIPAAGKGVICFTVDDSTQTVYIVCIAYAGADWMRKVMTRR